MSFVEALTRYTQLQGLAVDGCTDRRIDWVILLDEEGQFMDLLDHRFKPPKRKKGEPPVLDPRKVFRAPNTSRSSGVTPFLLMDYRPYVFGPLLEEPDPEDKKVYKDWKRETDKHTSFINLLQQAYDEIGHPHLNAILTFYAKHRNQLGDISEIGVSDWITFQVGESFPIEEMDLRSFWLRWLRGEVVKEEASSGSKSRRKKINDGPQMTCSLCHQPCEPLHVHGVDFWMPSESRTKLISANKDSEQTYGWEQSCNSPMCADCVGAYTTALSALTNRNSPNRLQYGNQVGVFWVESEVNEDDDWAMLDSPKVDQVEALLTSIYHPRRSVTQAWETTNVQCWWLDNHKARLFIRGGSTMSLSALKSRIASFFRRQSLSGEKKWYGVKDLALTTIKIDPKKSYMKNLEQVPDHVFLSILRHVMEGLPLPATILHQVIRRCQIEGKTSRTRATMIKLFLSQIHPEMEESYMSLELKENRPAYLCGRLLVLLDEAKYQAVKSSVSVSERSYGSAAISPAATFGILLQNVTHHLAKLRKTKPGVAYAIQSEIESVMVKLHEFPQTLTPEEQAWFALGHFHQSQAIRERIKAAMEAKKTKKQMATATTSDQSL